MGECGEVYKTLREGSMFPNYFRTFHHGSSVPLLAALVIGKTLIDLVLHQRSNRA